MGVLAACSGESDADVGGPMTQGESPPPAQAPASSDDARGDVTLDVAVEGVGFIRSEPAGIECPGRCSATFAPGTLVTLTQSAGEGWSFERWSGACSGVAASCSVTIDGDTSVGANLSLLDPRWDPSVGAADCANAWGAAGANLSPCDTTKDDYVVVNKTKRNTALCSFGKLVKNFRSGLGSAPVGTKLKQGDGRTPEGIFYIPRVLPDSDYYLAFLFSYPTKDDAARGFADGLIGAQVRDDILAAHAACKEPPQTTALGGAIEIHGYGSDEDWTAGCVALDDQDIDVLWATMGVGDTIVVLP